MNTRPYVELARPHQWAKNGLLFAGYVFAGRMKAGATEAIAELISVVIAFGAFCCMSAFVYTINDIKDCERDRHHPLKRQRPIASGRVSLPSAVMFAGICVIVGLALAVTVTIRERTPLFLIAAIGYPVWGFAYSLLLKDIVIVDVLAVAGGFVLRVVAGCLAIRVSISPWLILCTLLIALFVALCKRRHELLLLGDRAHNFRNVLPRYSATLLDQMIAATAATTIMAYSLYTFNAPHILLGNSDSPWLMLTIPYVIYGMFRYLYLAYRTDVAGAPEKMLQDVPLMLTIVLWMLTVILLGVFAHRA